MPSTPARLPAGITARAAFAAAVAAAGLAALPRAVPAADAPVAPAADAPPAAPAAPTAAPTAAPAAAPYPEPKFQPTTWELRPTLGTPKRIAVNVPGQPGAKAYWYLTYTVVNDGDASVEFDPVIEMLDAEGRTHRANRAVPSEVFDAIKRREGNRLLTDARKIVGPIKPGDDQARTGVAIWPEPLGRMGTFAVFFAGLSGEAVTVKKVGDRFVPIDPTNAADELKDVKEEDRRNLRKQYAVTYRVLGDEVSPGNDPVQKRSERWVMRD